MISIAVLVTSHDRREHTLACLAAVRGQRVPGASIDVVLVDAGSADRTAAAVRDRFPDARVIERGPDLFWNGGMRVAWAAAREQRPDAYLWLNDDTVLDDDAVARLLEVHERYPDRIVVGATRDPETGAVTYSGVARPEPRWRPLSFVRVEPGSHPRPVETMNGNCVLVPASVADRVGGLDARFTHGIGDFDYGLRARDAGVGILLAPGTVGTCAANPVVHGRSVRRELAHLRGPKGLPPSEWRTFVRRWAGPLWPLYAVTPYLRPIRRRLSRTRSR